VLAWTRRAAALGVDLVVAHHPHVAHPLLQLGPTTAALSLGNYAFGTEGRPALNEGLMLFAEIEGRRLARVELVPIDVQNRRVGFQPRPLIGEALDEALDRLVRESRALGTALERSGDRAILKVAAR
jgi:poly-gamma-glutamate capsule biosynthesis protein CapA/YwtB (metallophosphatase superfamily)